MTGISLGKIKMDVQIKPKLIAVLGLGYVGLPLLKAISASYRAVGYDIDARKVEACRQDLADHNSNPQLTSSLQDIEAADVYIVTVPTPINEKNIPDLSHLVDVSTSIASLLSPGDLVIYESTVYPGCTEEVCLPILQATGLKLNVDFSLGYSPERVSPGEADREVRTVSKIISASNDSALVIMEAIYGSVTSGEIHIAESIKVAEAAKVLENTQRDVNIAIMNQVCKYFKSEGIETRQVLAAAGTKWNFMAVSPGLVGGHCIGVDPYYLLHRSGMLGCDLSLVREARVINENFVDWIANEIKSLYQNRYGNISNASILIFGASYKANVGDVRNSKVINLVNIFANLGCKVSVFDPLIDVTHLALDVAGSFSSDFKVEEFDIVIYAVDHDLFHDTAHTTTLSYAINSENIMFCDFSHRFVNSATDFSI